MFLLERRRSKAGWQLSGVFPLIATEYPHPSLRHLCSTLRLNFHCTRICHFQASRVSHMPMDSTTAQPIPRGPRYIQFPAQEAGILRDGKPLLNRWSSTLTNDHDFPGAQAMLYAAGVPNREMMKTAPHVGEPAQASITKKILLLTLGRHLNGLVGRQSLQVSAIA